MSVHICWVVAMGVLLLADVTRMDQSVNREGANSAYEVLKAANTPEFLKLATDLQRKEYIELESNMNVPVGMLRIAQDAWANKTGEPVLTAYKQHVATEDAVKAAETVRMDKAVEKLSQPAQEADRVIRGIYSNESLTRKEINQMVATKMQELPRRVYNELTVALQ